ncbi:MAG: hypothetical protein ACRDTS_18985, partial [Mycobacterium sp.]
GTPLAGALMDVGFEATLDFITCLPRHLAPNGRSYLLTSSIFERAGYDVDKLCRQHALMATLVEKLDAGYETYRVHKVEHLEAHLRAV